MRYFLSSLVIVWMSALSVVGQSVENVLTVNSPVQMFQSNVGITGFDMQGQKAGIIWPRGSDNQFVFGIGLWLGAHVFVDENTPHKLVAITFNPFTGTGWCEPRSAVELDDDVTKNSTSYNTAFDDNNLDRYDHPAKRNAEGYPLGLEFQQRLTVFSEGPFKDVAILHTSVRNNHPTRDLYNFIIGTVMDVDIGKTTSPQQAALRDRVEFVHGTDLLGIMKFWDDSTNTMWNPGVLGVAFVDDKTWGGMGSAKVQSYVDFAYVENIERYDAIATQALDAEVAPGDLIALCGKSPVERLRVGGSVSSTMVMMFGNENTAANDQAMIEMVKTLRATVAVKDDVGSTSHTSIFPNPATASHVYLLSDADIDRLEVYTTFGQLVKATDNPSSTIGIDNLSAGQYHIAVYKGRDVSHHQLVVLR